MNTINKNNFYINSMAVFFKVEKPERNPDFTSTTGDGNFPSQYWFGADAKGEYVIRYADHWGRVQNCLWFITDKEMSVYGCIHDIKTKSIQEDLYGKCYFSEILDLSGIRITFKNFTFESFKSRIIKNYDFVATAVYSNSGKTRYKDKISLFKKSYARYRYPHGPIIFRLDYKSVPNTHISLVDAFIDREYDSYLYALTHDNRKL